MSDITHKMYLEAKEVVAIYEGQLIHDRMIGRLNSLLEEGQSLEYRDMGYGWYPYDKGLQGNRHL